MKNSEVFFRSRLRSFEKLKVLWLVDMEIQKSYVEILTGYLLDPSSNHESISKHLPSRTTPLHHKQFPI